MKYATNSALFFASTFLLILPVRADVAPPETAPCAGKQAGTACTYNAAGICQDSTCSRLDYANWDRDAATVPPTTTYVCLKCVTGTATATVTGTDPGTGSKTTTDTATATSTPTATDTVTATATPTTSDTDTATSAPTATATATTTATVTATTTVTTNPPTVSDTATASDTVTGTGTKGDEPPADDDSACSVGRGVSVRRVAPWLLAASFSLLFLFARRRRR